MRRFLYTLMTFLIVSTVGQPSSIEAAPKQSRNPKTRSQKKKNRQAPPARPYVERRPESGFGITMGYEATLGNAISYHWMPMKSLELYGGVGANNTGAKLGAGGTWLFYLTKSLGIRSGAALVYSSGSSGEVAIDAKFTPEGTTKEEAIEASKTYQVGSAIMFNTLLGGFWALSKETHLIADATYNTIVSGNEVTLSDEIQYSRRIEATNNYAFETKFDADAADKAAAGGLGFNAGIRFLW